MRITLGFLVLAGLAACAPGVPDSARGVGFEDYDTYQKAQDAELSGTEAVRPPSEVSATALDADGAPLSDEAKQNSGEEPVQASPSNPAPALNNPGISDENDFGAVSSRQSIESDAERIARNRELYQVVQPTDLPSRTGSSGPNVVEYALRTSNPVGNAIYKRGGFNAQAKFDRNCAKYPSPDMAQSAFLANGGPDKDRLGLDPDGDGYACYWNPEPFRKAAAVQE